MPLIAMADYSDRYKKARNSALADSSQKITGTIKLLVLSWNASRSPKNCCDGIDSNWELIHEADDTGAMLKISLRASFFSM
jgi:hypothetical protein